MHEQAITKKIVPLSISIETVKKVEKKYGGDGVSQNKAFETLIEEAVEDVRLSVNELNELEEIYAENHRKRMARRNKSVSHGFVK